MDSLFHDLFSLSGRTVLMTGGTRGIGATMALTLAQAGADIILIQRQPTPCATYHSIISLGRKCTIHFADLSSQRSVEAVVPTLLSQGHNPTILVNAAGVQIRHPADRFPLDDWNTVMQVNLTSVFILCRDFGAHLLSLPDPEAGRSRGSIINLASMLTYQGGINVPAYAASKGGIAQLTKALSNQWAGRRIKVNAIAPGYIDTEMNSALIGDERRAEEILARIPVGRWGTPGDFRGVMLWLAGEGSGYVSGTVVDVDGGWMGR